LAFAICLVKIRGPLRGKNSYDSSIFFSIGSNRELGHFTEHAIKGTDRGVILLCQTNDIPEKTNRPIFLKTKTNCPVPENPFLNQYLKNYQS
jgi:hypothetical protein